MKRCSKYVELNGSTNLELITNKSCRPQTKTFHFRDVTKRFSIQISHFYVDVAFFTAVLYLFMSRESRFVDSPLVCAHIPPDIGGDVKRVRGEEGFGSNHGCEGCDMSVLSIGRHMLAYYLCLLLSVLILCCPSCDHLGLGTH